MRGIFHYCLKIAKLQTLQNISIMNGEKYCKYYKITDITNHSNIYVLVCQSNAERKLQNYITYKYLYNRPIKKKSCRSPAQSSLAWARQGNWSGPPHHKL